MHKTHLPLSLWFWSAYLVSTHAPGISALQLRRQLGITRYETAWMVLHKLRRAMVAPEREPLRGEGLRLHHTRRGGRGSVRPSQRHRWQRLQDVGGRRAGGRSQGAKPTAPCNWHLGRGCNRASEKA
jgi:hypothetical protein